MKVYKKKLFWVTIEKISSFKFQTDFNELRRESYVEFVGLTRVRSGTTIPNEATDASEKIINEIVAMDASFDPYDLPDMSRGKRDIAGIIIYESKC